MREKGKKKKKKRFTSSLRVLNGWVYLIYNQDFAGNGRDEVFGQCRWEGQKASTFVYGTHPTYSKAAAATR